MNEVLLKDIIYIHRKLPLEQLANKTVLITGATGLIASTISYALLEWNKQHKDQMIHIIVAVRNREKCEKMFAEYFSYGLQILVTDVTQVELKNMSINYIIHCANFTSSAAFINQPVEVVKTAIYGTIRMLELSRCNPVESFVFLSSMEVYGTPSIDEKITEDYLSNLDALKVRNSYPESKRMCENLCVDYATEYGISAKIVRLTQTFGPGVSYQDGRVFAEFARCVIEHRDIILKTKGETKRCYLYTADAVTAILTVMVKGESGQAYNAANESSYCSIYEMANQISKLANPPIQVKIMEEDIQKYGYAEVFKMNLSTSKLRQLGWNPEISLVEMYSRMIATMDVDK